jgi:hypothetical protein
VDMTGWKECWICKAVFDRILLTKRYCQECGQPYCDGQHGRFMPGGPGLCIVCCAKRKKFTYQEETSEKS